MLTASSSSNMPLASMFMNQLKLSFEVTVLFDFIILIDVAKRIWIWIWIWIWISVTVTDIQLFPILGGFSHHKNLLLPKYLHKGLPKIV